MKILVTGAGGFVGSQVVRRILLEGHWVQAVVGPRGSTGSLPECRDRLSVVQADLRDAGKLRRIVSELQPHCAIHLAWYTAPGCYWTAPENLDCVKMSLSLAEALAEAGCKRLVAAGSCAEYDRSHGLLSEDLTPVRPSSLYAACKNATREILQEYCERRSIGFAWTRLFCLYGPGEAKERLVPSVILALLNGETARCTAGKQIRDYLHVEDAGAAVWAVAKSTLTGPVNVGSGQPLPIRTLVETIGRIAAVNGGVQFGALTASPEGPPRIVADVRKLKTHTGWLPTWNLEEGLRQVVSWWRSKKTE